MFYCAITISHTCLNTSDEILHTVVNFRRGFNSVGEREREFALLVFSGNNSVCFSSNNNTTCTR